MSFNTRVLLSLGAGLAAGVALQRIDPALAARASDVVAPVGALWVNALLMLVMPLVLASLVVGVAGAADAAAIGRLGARAAGVFLVMVTITAAIAVAIVPGTMALLHVDPSAAESLRASASVGASLSNSGEVQTAGQWFASLLPANPVRSALDGRLLPLVIFAVLFSVALTRVPRDRAMPVIAFSAGVVEALRTLVAWVLALAPIGVSALAFTLAVRFGVAAAGLLGFYLAVACVLCTIVALGAFPVAALGGRVPLRAFARAAAPAWLVGFVSRSSIATLPSLMDGARALKLPESVSTFVLPLSVAAFKCTAPLTFLSGAYFLARIYGVPVSSSQLPFIAVQAVLLSFAVPGIPYGSIITSVPIIATLGVPAEGLGLLIAVDMVADMFRSSSNVGLDLAAATVVARGVPA